MSGSAKAAAAALPISSTAIVLQRWAPLGRDVVHKHWPVEVLHEPGRTKLGGGERVRL